ncbi:hypothetical protein GOBAR_DD30043 [Gossypium barbadense]|nr:hypothetical protein GOBAR_DD30043 [Gossypium barbadense]
MNNEVFLVYVLFYGEIVKGDVGCVFKDVEDFSDPDVDEVSDDIDDEGPEEDEDVYGSSFSNPSRGTILRNEPGGDMLNEDPNVAHASEFPKYTDIVPTYRLASNSQFEELFVTSGLDFSASGVHPRSCYGLAKVAL